MFPLPLIPSRQGRGEEVRKLPPGEGRRSWKTPARGGEI